MLANYLIGLREGLEASLVIGILIAYIVRTGRRDLLGAVWIGIGIATGVSLAAGAALTLGPRELSFTAKETLGGVLSIAAVGLITWMIFWMGKTARFLKRHLEDGLEKAIALGKGAIIAMALLAVGREGLETALFLWAGIQAAGSTSAPITGAVLGLATAIALGYLIYRGAVRINLRMFFQWTGLFLIVVAAGVLAYAIHDLQEAGVLPGSETLAFDVTAAIPPGSFAGTLLKGIFNFSPESTILQVITWVLYLVPTLWLFSRMAFARTPQRAPSPELATTTAI
ncbi:iron uptake transporter permease EfeU [Demequina lutea]|uniref:High-affinity iron transporter n=1 Tax=Demequina lutea TaxID=431489 RepID=A0A7Z0CG22_9MICO|nr:iron uptake transporter permease EfeU [Demequina lutea]NYI39901.1 high-affinity iron transporter [Demequina lutea]